MNELKEKILEICDSKILSEIVSICNSWDGSLENYYYYPHDEEFYELFKSKDDVAARVYYSGDNYRYMDEYVQFDGYGNLITHNQYEIDVELEENKDEILDTYLELIEKETSQNQYFLTSNSEFNELVEELLEYEE